MELLYLKFIDDLFLIFAATKKLQRAHKHSLSNNKV